MTPLALEAFLREYGITHPVGVDKIEPEQRLPVTMRAYSMQGTPTLILIDRQGRLCMQDFGHVDDLQLGMVLGRLLAE